MGRGTAVTPEFLPSELKRGSSGSPPKYGSWKMSVLGTQSIFKECMKKSHVSYCIFRFFAQSLILKVE